MDERRIKLLETALKLFAKKGYNKTSIQEITQAWGISKGAFYHNFSSKEELMLSIMKHYTELWFKQVQNVKVGSSEKEILIEQLRIQFSIIELHKEFIGVQLTEQVPQLTEELRNYIFETRAKTFKWLVKRLLNVYGPQIEPFVFDCVVLLHSMVKGYMRLILMDHKPLNFEKTARFLVNRLDSMVSQFPGETPLLTKEMMKEFLLVNHDLKQQCVQTNIASLKNALIAPSDNIQSALDVLEAEFRQDTPREYIAEGLLLYLEKQKVKEWNFLIYGLAKAIEAYFHAQK